MRIGTTALLCCVGLMSGAAAARDVQPVPAAPPANEAADPIVVTGSRLTPEQARARAVQFIRETGVASGDTPVARWVDPVCVTALGLVQTQTAEVEAQIRAIAQAAGIRVARAPCRSNVTVSFTADARAVVRTVATRAPGRLSEVPGEARTALLEGQAPIRWWYSTQPRSPHGIRESTNTPSWAAVDGGAGGGSGLPGNVPNQYHYNSSMISTQTVRALTASSVVVDMTYARGMPLEALAAYAAVVAFAEIRENDFSSTGSILGLFAGGGNGPREFTDWDMAFLRALYRVPLDRNARMQRGVLVRDLLAAVSAGE